MNSVQSNIQSSSQFDINFSSQALSFQPSASVSASQHSNVFGPIEVQEHPSILSCSPAKNKMERKETNDMFDLALQKADSYKDSVEKKIMNTEIRELSDPEPEGQLFDYLRKQKSFDRYKLTEKQIFSIICELENETNQTPKKGPKGSLSLTDKMLYYLEWLSSGTTQTRIGIWFNRSSHIISDAIIQIRQLLLKVLRKMNMEKRRPKYTDTDESFGTVALLVDATSIRTDKPASSFENQKLLWDGHHKVYGLKIQVAVAASYPYEALFASEVIEGHIHDFSLFKRDLQPLKEYLQITEYEREKYGLDEGIKHWKVMADRGYQGAVEGIEVITPIKNAKTIEEITFNERLAKKRIPVEWFFGRMKRQWKQCANRYRNGLDDAKLDIEIAVWLTNLNIQAYDLSEDDGLFEKQCFFAA
ncbi:putative DDE superfamily endonuclease [Monocercomonoides exilis]|uniref:putative DDE superfamily endonuclease n=1 Tax=Monocercomonoides exilis TaxID=2049356 RepID=UPI003559F39E|nr:putative DDE superfamily endonuclease [Monocercomonoides exilis]|eukprot:MONOS_4615.1-p1 / transcript=MONOS_4615.1 / gene=MONOS_4615 / organism=Monocercomonoides_exilis_PA203 / gene_product=unspecified product / transcript_product=unspecified product / location=Mono_scaffold00124:101283-102930(+) / protein_length=416 / sequence_SO=supercontig / SO=protein_coding / is_pseudo=false